MSGSCLLTHTSSLVRLRVRPTKGVDSPKWWVGAAWVLEFRMTSLRTALHKHSFPTKCLTIPYGLLLS